MDELHSNMGANVVFVEGGEIIGDPLFRVLLLLFDTRETIELEDVGSNYRGEGGLQKTVLRESC